MRKSHKIILSVGILGLFIAGRPLDLFAEIPMAKAKAFFMQKQYVEAIEECTAVIHEHPNDPDVLSEANYFAGASYANLFDFLTAKKNFDVIIAQYKGSPYYEDAYMGLGDVEFLQENYSQALKVYHDFLTTQPSKKRLATLYFRLAEVNLKMGDKAEYQKYFDKLQNEFPLSFEARDARRLTVHEDFYTVQVGAFTNYENAQRFIERLKSKGYDVYSVLCMLSGKKLCRIRIGKYKTLGEAEEVKKALEKDGYFAKIFP